MGEGKGGKIWENDIETCIMSYMKRVARPGSMHDTGCLGLVHWDDPEGWYGEGGGIIVLYFLLISLYNDVFSPSVAIFYLQVSRLFATP